MKATLALCAVAFLSWTLAAPVVLMALGGVQNQHDVVLKPTVPPLILSTQSQLRIPSKMTIEQADLKDIVAGRPNNRPYAPSDNITPSEALAAPRPLISSYLLSLASKLHKQAQVSHASVRQDSSIVREETGSTMKLKLPTIVELETEGSKPFFSRTLCHMHKGPAHYHDVRKYADMVIVVMVLAFVAGVVLLEMWTPIQRRLCALHTGEGAIRLEDGEQFQYPQTHPFVPQPVSKPVSKPCPTHSQ
ncbi:uncharacterized protein BCR38DRAFT_407310 [Pseudomassariella vexata]|uniref:Uncharacterized protein n=1 Tax=Pseudomassariella vexata TaxID=1141098 RepID=A0A1Y2E6Z1_9PEZI|nr:uncharacterized protein BCR38DRAFT_407310 [Pseudomassariella vexata]ORY67328.1 hypothetical protein BCR38DRAFT_407310 [Pseudomassariella vexata]